VHFAQLMTTAAAETDAVWFALQNQLHLPRLMKFSNICCAKTLKTSKDIRKILGNLCVHAASLVECFSQENPTKKAARICRGFLLSPQNLDQVLRISYPQKTHGF
jgi:hypothetical protein